MHAYIPIHKFTTQFTDIKESQNKNTIVFIINSTWPTDSHRMI